MTVVNYNTPPPFPDVSICNLNPLNVKSTTKDIITPNEYLHRMNALRIISSNNFDPFADDELWEQAISMLGYVTNYHDALESGDIAVDLIETCDWFNWRWAHFTKANCMKNIIKFRDAEYMQCSTISLRNVTGKENVRGLSVLVHVEDVSDIELPTFHMNMLHSVAKGIHIQVHAPQTLPDMTEGVSISPGKETTVHLHPIKRVLLDEPYSTCVRASNFLDPDHAAQWAFLRNYTDQPELLQYQYSPTLCLELCQQDSIINTCGCVSPRLFWTEGMLHKKPNLTLCGNFHLDKCDIRLSMSQRYACWKERGFNFSDTLLKMNCSMLHEKQTEKCTELCIKPCTSFVYKHQITQADWPHEAYVGAFFHRYRDGKWQDDDRDVSDMKEYIYGEPENCTIPADDEQENHPDRMQLNSTLQNGKQVRCTKQEGEGTNSNSSQPVKMISRQFLQLHVYINEKATTEDKETPAMPLTTLMANLGGVLNLWAGITFYTLFEIVELAFYQAREAWTGRKGQKVHSLVQPFMMEGK